MNRTLIAVSVVSVMFSAQAMAISTKDITVPEATYPTLEHFNKHVQGSLNEDRSRIKELESRSNGQEATFSAGLRDSVDRDSELSQAIQDEQAAREVTEERSVNNAERLDGTEVAIRETNNQVTADRDASVSRDESLRNSVNMNEAVNKAYRQQTAEQFAKHEAALASERHDRQEADTDLKAGVASAVAIGSHHFDTNYRGMQLSLSGGFYDGENAQSLSLGGALTENVFGSLAASTDSRGKQAYSVQSTIKF